MNVESARSVTTDDRSVGHRHHQGTASGLRAIAPEKYHPMAAHLPPTLRAVSILQQLRKGEHVFRLGDEADAVYQVVHGTVGISCGLPICDATPFLLLGVGDYLVETDGVHRHNALFHDKGGAVLRIPFHAFRAVLIQNGPFAAAFGMQMAERAQRLHRQAERRSLNSTEDRLCHYLMTESEEGCGRVSVRTYAALADELGVAHETLSRLLKSMLYQGKIRREGRIITLIRQPIAGEKT